MKIAQLYRLTDLGRVFEREIPVVEGRVALTGIAARTPYVLYRDTPAALPDMKWGEGGLVKDPGFGCNDEFFCAVFDGVIKQCCCGTNKISQFKNHRFTFGMCNQFGIGILYF